MTRRKKTKPVTLNMLGLNLRQAWSTPACRACSEGWDWLSTGLHKSTGPQVEDRAQGLRGAKVFASALPSSVSSAIPSRCPPRSTRPSITPRHGMSLLWETTVCGDGSQQLFQPVPYKSLAAEPAEVGPPSMLWCKIICSPFTVSAEPRGEIQSFLPSSLTYIMNINIILHRESPWWLMLNNV